MSSALSRTWPNELVEDPPEAFRCLQPVDIVFEVGVLMLDTERVSISATCVVMYLRGGDRRLSMHRD